MLKKIIILFFILLSPATIIAATDNKTKADYILIEKKERQLTLYCNGKAIKKYKVALGSSPVGLKTRQGDNKTPEGIYTINGRNANSSYHRSLRISYPNRRDLENARKAGYDPGGDIMIHGLPNGRGWVGSAHRLTDWTWGCIAVTDEEIEEIWDLVPIGTKVEIRP